MLRLVALILAASTATWAQLYGANNCRNQSFPQNGESFCGDTSTCTPAQNAAALAAFNSYFGGIATGNLAQSGMYTTGDGGEKAGSYTTTPFRFEWKGDPTLVPYAGTYEGSKALTTFFGLALGSLTTKNGAPDFAFNLGFSPKTSGLQVVAANCQFIVAHWQEVSTVAATGKPITNGDNFVKYTMFDFNTPKIAVAQVYTNNAVYQNANCAAGSQVTAIKSSAPTQPSSKGRRQFSSTALAGGIVGGILGGALLAGLVMLGNLKRAEGAGTESSAKGPQTWQKTGEGRETSASVGDNL